MRRYENANHQSRHRALRQVASLGLYWSESVPHGAWIETADQMDCEAQADGDQEETQDCVIVAAYYNEIEPFAAAWLRELMKAGLIADGTVDERPIEQVEAADLKGFCQCHFFAGIGVWSHSLRAAGWPDDSPVWTGSCPCQSFSASGKRGGFSDKRHLWPAWFRLIRECNPHVIFGEQVGGQGGKAWFDVVSADLEGIGYAVGAAITGACGFGAPHIRKRLYFVADAGWQQNGFSGNERQAEPGRNGKDDRIFGRSSGELRSRMADAEHSLRRPQHGIEREAHGRDGLGRSSQAGDLDHAGGERLSQRSRPENGRGTIRHEGTAIAAPGLTNGFWRDCEWLPCRDGKWRPTQPGLFPLATGSAKRVGRLRGYGNCIVAPQAQGFIEAYVETQSQR